MRSGAEDDHFFIIIYISFSNFGGPCQPGALRIVLTFRPYTAPLRALTYLVQVHVSVLCSFAIISYVTSKLSAQLGKGKTISSLKVYDASVAFTHGEFNSIFSASLSAFPLNPYKGDCRALNTGQRG